MIIIEPSVTILSPTFNTSKDFMKAIEIAGRTCYKSEDKITATSSTDFVRRLIASKHEAMLEHAPNISMRFICDRGVSHELVRHRLFSFAQESTRYVRYSNGLKNHITFIKPTELSNIDDQLFKDQAYFAWRMHCVKAEKAYLELLDLGVPRRWLGQCFLIA